jgi:uncharacterized protein (TIGR02186 family)
MIKIIKFNIFTFFLIIFSGSAYANIQNFVSGISSNEINISSNFTGQKILLFGAKSNAGKLIVAVRGPEKNFLVTKKGRTFGVWHNSKRIKFENASSYYFIFSTFDDNLVSDDLLKKLGIGSANLNYNIQSSDSFDKNEKINFKFELINNLKDKKLFSTNAGRIDFLDESLFKVELEFPKNVTQGVYNVDIYFVNDKMVESFQTIPIYVNQVGLSAKIYNSAYNNSFLYGVLAVIIALIIGWIANYLFARFIGK